MSQKELLLMNNNSLICLKQRLEVKNGDKNLNLVRNLNYPNYLIKKGIINTAKHLPIKAIEKIQ